VALEQAHYNELYCLCRNEYTICN